MSRIALLCSTLILLAFPVMAQSSNNNYIFLLASGFLCDPGDSSTCPATVKAYQGDSYEMSGAGTFDVQNKSVKATGTFTHRSTDGILLETGVWLANELVKFDSYGASPGALLRYGRAFGPAPFGPTRLTMPSGPMPTGGVAVFRIRLLPIRSPSRTAVLQVNCALGDVPHERSVEGIRLSIEGNANNFSEEAGGRVMFLAMRPEVSAPAKTPQDATPDSVEPPKN